ncbi:Alpha/Beta hydrolase protein [Cubamyces lactineus]|nr:Alpha/Beta hydrolase protein [Cubamyces lactineus]
MSNTTSNTTLRIFRDSGAPEGSTDYTTLVVVHGWGWKASIFKKLYPVAKQSNVRIVSVIRRDYPGGVSYTAEEQAIFERLASSPRSPDTEAEMAAFTKKHAYDVYHFLVDFIKQEKIPPASNGEGGIILTGWSMGATSVSALLAHAGSYPASGISLSAYLQRAVMFDVSNIFFGYASPNNVELYHPMHDPTLHGAERLSAFDQWLTSYFQHGDVMTKGVEALESRVSPNTQPTSTYSRLTPEEIAELTHPPATLPTSSDFLSMIAGIMHGTYAATKELAFYPPEDVGDLRGVELRIVWCDRSFWETPLSAYLLSRELAQARNEGRSMRDIELVRLKGGNHFAHWDMPEKVFKAFVGNDSTVE